MFFLISKLFTILIRPLFWVVVLLIWTLIAKKQPFKNKLIWISLLLLLLTSNKIVVNELALLWEPESTNIENLPRTAVVLGGFSKYDEARKQISITEAGERLFKALELYQTGKIDTIIISGGAASILGRIKPESVYAREYLVQMGVKPDRIFIDSNSKNTFENARETKKILLNLNAQNRKIALITSAFHMRRSIGVFKKAKFNVVPVSVQYLSNPKRGYQPGDFLIPSSEALYHFDAISKEWVGAFVYWITGKS